MKKSKLLFLAIPILAISLGCSKPVEDTVAATNSGTGNSTGTNSQAQLVTAEEREALKLMNGKEVLQLNSTSSGSPNGFSSASQVPLEISLDTKTFKLSNWSKASNSLLSYQIGSGSSIESDYYTGTDVIVGQSVSYAEGRNALFVVKEYKISRSLPWGGSSEEIYTYFASSSFSKYLHKLDGIQKEVKWIWFDPATGRTLVEMVNTKEFKYSAAPMQAKINYNGKTYSFDVKIYGYLEGDDLKNSSGAVIGKFFLGSNFKITVKVYNADKQLVDL